MKKRTKTKTQPVVIRNYRDTLFRMLYRNKVRLLSLFNAVNGTHYDNPDDLTITTLEGVLYLGMKNDVSCIIDMMMQLYEHQSTVNPNMPLRNLFYVSDLLQKYIYEEGIDIYSRKQIKIPTPMPSKYNPAMIKPPRFGKKSVCQKPFLPIPVRLTWNWLCFRSISTKDKMKN